jgi:DNA-binding CsgD family transcriptional regulator
MTEDVALIDLIYEAAVIPERWRLVLQTLTERIEGAHASLFTLSGGSMKWIGTPLAEDLIVQFVEAKFVPELNSRTPRGRSLGYPGFVNDFGLFTEEEIARDPFYTEFLWPRGYGWFAGTVIELPHGDELYFGFERKRDRGVVERKFLGHLDAMRPHLARAAMLSARLGLARAEAAAQVLKDVGLAAAVLRWDGKLLTANSIFEQLIPAVITDQRSRVTLVSKGADDLLANALAQIASGVQTPKVCSFPVMALNANPPMVAHLLPVAGDARDIFNHAMAVLVVTTVEKQKVVGANILQGLFDLSPAEARVARSIGQGKTVGEISDEFDLSRETIRTQLKATLAKTGTTRQAELVGLLANIKNLDKN